MIIAITGTPGCGKSWLSKKLSEKLGFKICDNNCITSLYPEIVDRVENGEKIIDTSKLREVFRRYVEEEIKKGNNKIIFDSLLSHEVSKDIVDLCIVVKAPLKTIKERMEARKYRKDKIEENLEAEILDVCGQDAIENGHNVVYFLNDFEDNEMLGVFKPNIDSLDKLISFIKKHEERNNKT